MGIDVEGASFMANAVHSNSIPLANGNQEAGWLGCTLNVLVTVFSTDDCTMFHLIGRLSMRHCPHFARHVAILGGINALLRLVNWVCS